VVLKFSLFTFAICLFIIALYMGCLYIQYSESKTKYQGRMRMLLSAILVIYLFAWIIAVKASTIHLLIK